MNPQRQLRLDVAENTRLITIETAKAALGVDLASIDAMIDEGALWAFNISSQGKIREIRIWIRSIPGAEHRPAATLDDVVSDIAGDTPEIRSGALQARLCCDDNTVYRLIDGGLITGDLRRSGKARTLWISAPSLKTFLRSRVLGAG